MTTLYATFDGQVFLPEKPISLSPDTRVRLHVEPAEIEPARGEDYFFLRVAQSLKLEGPPDWPERLHRRAPSTGLFVSADLELGEEPALFKESNDGEPR